MPNAAVPARHGPPVGREDPSDRVIAYGNGYGRGFGVPSAGRPTRVATTVPRAFARILGEQIKRSIRLGTPCVDVGDRLGIVAPAGSPPSACT